MIHYLSFYGCALIILLIGQFGKTYPKLTWWLLLIVVVSFVGLRDGVGQDFENYKKIYETGLNYNFNYGGLLFNYLLIKLKSNNIDFGVFIFISSAIYFYAAFNFIYKVSQNKFFATTLFILFPITFLSSISGIRQGWSLAFIMISTLYFFKGNLWLFIAFALLSVAFHLTAVIFYIYFLTCRKLNLTSLLLLAVFVLSVLWFILPLLQSIVPVGKDYLRYTDDALSMKDVALVFVLVVSSISILLLQEHPNKMTSDFVLKTSVV